MMLHMPKFGMKSASLPLLCALLLGCGPTPLPQLPSLPISDSDFTNALSGPPSSSPLGLSPTLQRQVKDWKAKQAQPISLEWPQVNLVGEIQVTGAFQVKLPAQVPASLLKSTDSYIHGLAVYSPCTVDTLKITPDTSQMGEVTLFTALPGVLPTAVLKPQMSPPPNFTLLPLFENYFNASGKAIYVSEDTTVKGELSCPNLYSDGGSSHLFVNMSFAKGWNAATLIYGAETNTIASKMLLRGGVTDGPVAP